MAKNIVLIGFMGVGKGQIGRILSQRTAMFVVDCDDLIESAANKKVKKIFEENGEAEFRKRELQVALWLEKNVNNSIVSTGGGFVNVPNLKKLGKIVYLHADFDTIIKRILSHPNAAKKVKKRPLLADLKKARKIHRKRLPLYREAADLIVNMNKHTIDEAASIICSKYSL